MGSDMRILSRTGLSLVFFMFLFSFSFVSVCRAAEADGIPEELRELQIKDGFIEQPADPVGKIGRITGKGRVVVVHGATQEAFYASLDDAVYEKDALYTLDDCRIRVEFKDRNVAILSPNSQLEIEEIYASLLKGEKKSLLGITKGKAIFYAFRLFSYRDVKFKVKTPTATIGVRGTKFGTEVERINNDQVSILDRMIASTRPELVQVNTAGRNFITRAYVFEGEVDVTSLIDGRIQRLRMNEILEADRRGLGEVAFDPARTKAFMEEVLSGEEQPPMLEPGAMERPVYPGDVEKMDKLDEIKQREVLPSTPTEKSSGEYEAPQQEYPEQGGSQQ